MWVKDPVPADARLILSGWAMAWPINSGTVLNGTEG